MEPNLCDNVFKSNELQNLVPYVTLRRALIIYLIIVISMTFVMFVIVRIKFWSAFVLAVIIGMISLTVFYLPIYIDFWSEFNSYTAIYSFIWLITPVIVVIYTVCAALSDKRNLKRN